jgi:hypothetical protein
MNYALGQMDAVFVTMTWGLIDPLQYFMTDKA